MSGNGLPVGLLIIVLYGMHGVFASGFVPIIHDYAPAHAAFAFGGYFAGIVIGQLFVARIRFIAAARYGYAASELLFAASLLGMGLTFAAQPWSLIVGRLAEGLFAGLSLPLMFAAILSVSSLGSLERRIALFNSVFAIGFVCGPPLLALLLARLPAASILIGFAGVFAALGLLLGALLDAPRPNPELPRGLPRWFATFFTLFLAKATYGFMLPYIAGTLAPRLAPLNLTQVMLLLSGVFVIGQVAAHQLTRRATAEALKLVLPLCLLAALLALRLSEVPQLLFAVAVVHSALLFVGYWVLAATPGDARSFALYHAMSDPGMIVGSLLAGFGDAGLAGLAVLALLPLGQRLGLVRT
jgi:MFS family permease